ncbi:hypothetical protein HY383_04190 [Candidatus Daviesbacteria bacterium]|nr:hypothetical protein [Candidatus Daviesbacteria bacterium]
MSYQSLTPEKLLSYFEGTIFQTFYDPDSTSKEFPPEVFLSYSPHELKELNNQKYGIYFSVNAFKDQRLNDNLVKLNAAYGDLDIAKEGDGQTPADILNKKREVFKKLRDLSIKPNIIIQTKNGVQPLFLIENPGIDKDTIKTYTDTICGLTAWSKNYGCAGDAVKDIARVLRLPGYYHQKGEPFMVEAYLIHEEKTTLLELSKLFPYFDERKIINDNSAKDGKSTDLDGLTMQEIALAALKEYGEPDAYFDDKGRIWIKRGVTGAFLGKMDNCDYIGSNSHELPYGNKITFVRELLKLESNAAAFKWIAQKFNLQRPVPAKESFEQLTDTTNAELINELFGNKIRFDHKRKRWLKWQDHSWQPDSDGSISRLAIEAARHRFKSAANIESLTKKTAISKWAIQSESRQRLDSALAISKNLLPIADNGENWDLDSMLLGVKNGVLDLKTGTLRDGKPEDRITMRAGTLFYPEAKCPLWEKFLNEIFENDENLISYIHKALGYTLTGSVIEQALFFGFGSGSNGKSVFFETINAVLGDYAHNAPASLLQRNAQNQSSNDVAATEFKRFLVSSETLSTSKLNEQRLKKWSGGDRETARYLYSEFFTFQPTCKVWLFINHKPAVEDDSFGFWRRVRLIPFNRKFKEEDQDKHLLEKLKTELPGILNWMVKGCLKWQAEGLRPTPEKISLATKNYQAENDELAEFLFEKCSELAGQEVKALELYRKYTEWAEKAGFKNKDALTKTAFGRRMADKFVKIHRETGWFYQITDEFAKNLGTTDELDPILYKVPIRDNHQNSLLKTALNSSAGTKTRQDSSADQKDEKPKITPTDKEDDGSWLEA